MQSPGLRLFEPYACMLRHLLSKKFFISPRLIFILHFDSQDGWYHWADYRHCVASFAYKMRRLASLFQKMNHNISFQVPLVGESRF